MLITFSCAAYANITMFGDVAVHLLRLMGHSGTVLGAILAEDVQTALECLVAAIQVEQQLPEQRQAGDEDDTQPVVSLYHRALPLIVLLKAAAKKKCNVMWS